ncbi:MAG: flagellin [Fimbriimonadaceae bacterium]
MSLKINTNIPAMIAMRQLSINEGNMQTSITRLSTGLRINTGSDDPAGLIISEGLRSQIAGIQQAVRNSQDAVNMTKTAEGALDEVARLLLSLRSIAVSSANTAVVDSNQLQANQTQVQAIVESLNRIADHTGWGAKRLLNGASGAVANITQTNLVNSAYIGGQVNGQTVRSGNITMTRVTPASQTTANLTTAIANGGTVVAAGTFAINGVSFTVEPGETLNSVLAKINSKANLTNVVASHTPGAGMTLTSTKFGSKFPIQYTETTNIFNGGSPVTPAVGADAVYTVTYPVEPTPNTASETFTGGQGPGVDGLTMSSPSGNRLVITPSGNNTSATTTIGSVNVGSVRFQIGANANQFASFSLPSVYARDLGTGALPSKSIATIDVTSEQGATEAMKIVDDAVQQLGVIRGRLGAFQQNFLESNMRSLGVAEENLTASESSIRDVDMAREMTEYTKINILRQSGMSVLAQASQAPQSILQLLRGG